MVKIFQLIKPMPNHSIGDILYEKEDCYIFENFPQYILEKNMVECSDDFFKEIKNELEYGDTFYFINTLLNVIEEEYEPSKHSKLLAVGNSFKSREHAIMKSIEISQILKK
jgi:hypothetical protein